MALEAEASKVAPAPDSVAPLEGMRMLVVGAGLAPVVMRPMELFPALVNQRRRPGRR